MSELDSLDLVAIARDGALMALAASSIVVGALRVNPRFFARHFPNDARAALHPLTPREKLVGRFIGLALIALLFGGPYLSANAFDQRMAGAAPALALFAHAFSVGMVFNLVDWLVIDEFLIGVLRPRWIVPPEVAHMDIPFEHDRHVRGFVTGTMLCAAMAALAVVAIRLL